MENLHREHVCYYLLWPNRSRERDHFVYILETVDSTLMGTCVPRRKRYYTGVTTDPIKRLREHNSGKCHATRGRSWQVTCVLSELSIDEAYLMERWFKSGDTIQKRNHFTAYARRYPGSIATFKDYGSAIGTPLDRWQFLPRLHLRIQRRKAINHAA